MGKEQNRPCKRSSEAKNKPNGFRGTCSEQEEIVKPSKTFWKRVILIVADGHCHRPDGEVLRKARSKEASAQRILEASAGAQSGPRNRKRGTTFVLLNFFFFICVASTPNNTFWASQINCWNWAFVDFFHSTSQATLPTLQPSGCESARQYARKRHNFGTMVSPNVDRWSKCRGWGLRYEGQVKKYKEIDAM